MFVLAYQIQPHYGICFQPCRTILLDFELSKTGFYTFKPFSKAWHVPPLHNQHNNKSILWYSSVDNIVICSMWARLQGREKFYLVLNSACHYLYVICACNLYACIWTTVFYFNIAYIFLSKNYLVSCSALGHVLCFRNITDITDSLSAFRWHMSHKNWSIKAIVLNGCVNSCVRLTGRKSGLVSWLAYILDKK